MERNAADVGSGGAWESDSPLSSSEEAAKKDPNEEASPKRPPPSECSSVSALPRKSVKVGHAMDADFHLETLSLSRGGWLSQLRSALQGVGVSPGLPQAEAQDVQTESAEAGFDGNFMTPRETFDHPPQQDEEGELPPPEEDPDPAIPAEPPLSRQEVYLSLQTLHDALTAQVREAQHGMSAAQADLQSARLLISKNG